MDKVAKLTSYLRKYQQVFRDRLKSQCYQQKNTSNVDTSRYLLIMHRLWQLHPYLHHLATYSTQIMCAPITNLGSLGHLNKTYSFRTTRPKGDVCNNKQLKLGHKQLKFGHNKFGHNTLGHNKFGHNTLGHKQLNVGHM